MIKAGILGGGQLGRMLLQAAINYPVETFVMENDLECPAAHLCHHFIKGDITNFDDVYAFGKQLDVITIEIENVNVEALFRLEEEGVMVYPKPAALAIIKNKILQKNFYKEHSIPTSEFIITNVKSDLQSQTAFLPAVHKLANGGYDGKGVVSINTQADAYTGFDEPAILEKKIRIKSELAVIIAVNEKGDTAIYPPVDMVFDPLLNMLSHQVSPAEVDEKVFWKAEAIALRVVKELKSPGIFQENIFELFHAN
jgi:5-(carboxyamino)imidazole ribonucleotide synthase